MGNEVDAMVCASCGKEERASEGYPCEGCADFICLMCTFDGINLCRACQAKKAQTDAAPSAPQDDGNGAA